MISKQFRTWHCNIHSFAVIELDVECDVVGTALECRFYATVQSFMKRVLDKFPFQDNTIEELSLLDPRNRLHLSSSALHISNKFVLDEHELDLDSLSLEFRDFKAYSNTQLPLFDPVAPDAIDHFRACMDEII